MQADICNQNNHQHTEDDMPPETMDVVFSFDTTGSMYPCLTQLRKNVKATVNKLFDEIPNIRVGVIAHGDYCDAPRTITKFDLSTDKAAICKFIEKVEPTGGGDAPEAYELALHEARSFSWTSGRNKAVVLIGDDVPHGPNEKQNHKKLDWRNELGLLLEANIHVHAVQALGRTHATKFYEEVARITGGFHLELNQFADVTDLLTALCYKQAGNADQLTHFEQEVAKKGGMNRSMSKAFSTLSGKKPSATKASFGKVSLDAVPAGRFQALVVDEDTPIPVFVKENGLEFKIGRGFYEFTKKVEVQAHKEVILQEKTSGDMFTGTKAREMLGLPSTGSVKIEPGELGTFRAFIQSTSPNRKLLAGTRFLYEVSDWKE